MCKSLLSILYSTVVDLADPITLHLVSAVLGTRHLVCILSQDLKVEGNIFMEQVHGKQAPFSLSMTRMAQWPDNEKYSYITLNAMY